MDTRSLSSSSDTIHSESSFVADNDDRPIVVRPNLRNRFYGPIVLLVGLTKAWENNQASKAHDESLNLSKPPEHAFKDFVNKLGQLCDSEKGGDTVTAFVVLKFPDRIHYRFASNRRDDADLICAGKFVLSVLQILGGTDEAKLQDKISYILRTTLSFTRNRVSTYVESLETEVAVCVRACERERTDESRSILQRLGELQDLLHFSNKQRLDNATFARHCESLIEAIDRLYRSDTEELIRNRTKEGRIDESKCWCDFRHAAGRLLSYLGAAKILVSTRKRWPELFENFDISYVSASSPATCPLPFKHRSAETIIRRMTSEAEVMAIYQAHAEELQMFKLDENIRSCAGSPKFRPIVHAEVLLLKSLEKDAYTHFSHFFNSYKYIGCSKPTCRLCDYYFTAHPGGFQVRPTHRNLYHNWRMPDLYASEGRQAEIAREGHMNKILSRIRDDVFRTLREKAPERKAHDSNTEPTYPIDSISGREPDVIQHVETEFTHLHADSSNHEATQSSSEDASLDTSDTSVSGSEDEEDGGVKL